MVVLVVNETGPRLPGGRALAIPVGIVLSRLPEVGKAILTVGITIPWAGILKYVRGHS